MEMNPMGRLLFFMAESVNIIKEYIIIGVRVNEVKMAEVMEDMS